MSVRFFVFVVGTRGSRVPTTKTLIYLVFHTKENQQMPRFRLAAIEGDFCDRLDEIARRCGAQPTGPIQTFSDWASVSSYCDEKGYLVASLSGNWTVLPDEHWTITAILVDTALGKSLVELTNSRVVATMAEPGAAMYGFAIYTADGFHANFQTQDGIEEDTGGKPIPEELKLDGEYNGNDILNVFDLLNLDVVDGVEECQKSALLPYQVPQA